MGEVLGFSNLAGTLVSLSTKEQVPYSVAHSLFIRLISVVSPQQNQQIIDNFRAQYLIVNESFLFVFSTLNENPFLSQDSLFKLQNFLQGVSRDFKIEQLFKKTLEVNYALEDILNNMDPACRVNPKVPLFQLAKPFQSFYPNSSSLLYLNKTWIGGLNSASQSSSASISLEKSLKSLTMTLPDVVAKAAPLVHPFVVQFTDSIPAAEVKKAQIVATRISENSELSASAESALNHEVCKLVIMEKTFVAFKSTTITNLRVVGQIGVELYSKTEGKATIHVQALDWSDSKKIGKRVNEELLRQLDDFSYEVDIGRMKETTKVIEYIVSPNVIEIKNLPIFAIFSVEKLEASWLVQVKYQVSAHWKNPLEDVSFAVLLTCSECEIMESNSRGELQGNVIHWRVQKLLTSQKGILEARLKSPTCHIDHTKIQFRSNNTILSPVSASLSFNSSTSPAVLKYLSEIVISNE